MKPKHTLEPWAINGASFTDEAQDLGYCAINVEDERGSKVASVQGKNEKQLMANAHLITMAPELLRIAKAYRNLLRATAQTDGQFASYHHIEGIIAKAEGRE